MASTPPIERQQFLVGPNPAEFTLQFNKRLDEGWLAYPSTLFMSDLACHVLLYRSRQDEGDEGLPKTVRVASHDRVVVQKLRQISADRQRQSRVVD